MKTEFLKDLALGDKVVTEVEVPSIVVTPSKHPISRQVGTISIDGSDYILSSAYPSIANDETAGLIQTGFTQSGDNYPVKLSEGKAYVTVPWMSGDVNVDDVTIGKKNDATIYVKSIAILSSDFDGVFATEKYVDDSIASSKATFRGTYQKVSDLPKSGISSNDYAFVVSADESGDPEYARFKYASNEWLFEYVLNNSSFTAEQWSAINSKITEGKVNKLVLTDNISVSYWNEAYEKQSGIEFGDLASRDLSSIAGENLEKYVDGGVEKLRALQPTAADLSGDLADVFAEKADLQLSVDELLSSVVKLEADASGNKTAVTIGSRSPYEAHAVGEGSIVAGNGCDASGAHSVGVGAWSTANGDYSTAVGVSVRADGKNSHVAGYFAEAAHNHSFVWQGGEDNETRDYYVSHGNGTFNISPLNGAAGVFIGEEPLPAVLSGAVRQYEKTAQQLSAELSDTFQPKGNYLSSSTAIPSDISDLTDITGKLKTAQQLSAELGLSSYMKKSELSDFLIVVDALPENPDPDKFYFITK